MNSEFFKVLRRLFFAIKKKRRIQIVFLIIISILSGISEMVSIGSLVPFLTFLNDPNLLLENKFVSIFVETTGISMVNSLLLPLTIVFCVAAVLAGIIKMFNLWLGGRLSALIGTDLAVEGYKGIIFQSYSKYIEKKSGSYISNITLNTAATVSVVFQIVVLTNGLFVGLGIIAALLIIEPRIAFFAFFGFAIVYLFVIYIFKNKLVTNSIKIAESNEKTIQLIQEGLGSIRNLILDRTQKFYLSQFSSIDKPMRIANAQNTVLAIFPRYAVESIGLLIIGIFAFILNNNEGFSESITLLGVLALGSQKLLPAYQQIYSAWACIKGNKNAITNVLDLLEEENNLELYSNNVKPLKLKKNIEFKDVCFSYGSSSKIVLENISFKINKGERVGFIGKTGSGKSTIIDLIASLLRPTSGNIYIDSKDIYTDNLETLSWRLNISYVPQTIFISNKSFAENIAFGIKKEEIDLKRVRKSAKFAKLDSFIESFQDGYNHNIYENGKNLSGGQRQRIGIARAIYKRSNVLIFDEATSSLDNETESSLMSSIYESKNNLTIIIITHKLETLKGCDKIYEINEGKLIKTYLGKERSKIQ